MLERIKRLFTRSYDGAAGGRRWRSQPEMRSPVSASLQARGTLAARARYAVANNPLASAGVSALVTQTIGAGIKPSSLHTNPEILDAAFSDWVDVALVSSPAWNSMQPVSGLRIMFSTIRPAWNMLFSGNADASRPRM